MPFLNQNVYSDKIFWTFCAVLFLTGCGVKRSATLPELSNNPFVREFSHLAARQIDSLQELFGKNKRFVEEFKEPALIALSYYPELEEVPIEFKYSRESSTMAARPVFLSIFGKTRYHVLINNQDNFPGELLRDIPFNAQVGIVAHELSHIADYESRNFFGLLSVAFRFLDDRRKPLFERETDRATVERGLGWQLYDWAVFSMEICPRTSGDYIAFKRRTYLLPEEIESLILFFSNYAKTFGGE